MDQEEGEVKERIWKILDHVSIHDVILYAKRRNMEGYNRAWRIEEDGKIIEAHEQHMPRALG